jgi:hypothetical protein
MRVKRSCVLHAAEIGIAEKEVRQDEVNLVRTEMSACPKTAVPSWIGRGLLDYPCSWVGPRYIVASATCGPVIRLAEALFHIRF